MEHTAILVSVFPVQLTVTRYLLIDFSSVFKSNFATLDEKTGIVVSRRADRHFEEEGPILCAALDGLKLPSFPHYEVRLRYCLHVRYDFYTSRDTIDAKQRVEILFYLSIFLSPSLLCIQHSNL